MAKRRYFSGDSLEQAVLEAAGHHGLEPEQVAWRQIEKRHGFLRVRRNVVIEVDPESPREEPPAGREEVRAATEPELSETPAQSGTPAPDAAAEAEPPPAGVEPEPPAAAEAEAPSLSVETKGPAGGESAEAAEAAAAKPERAARGAVSEGEVREAMELLLELSDLAVDPHVKVQGDSITVDLRGPEEEFLREEEGEALKVLEHLALRMLGAAEGRIDSFRIDSAGFRDGRDDELRRRAVEAAREVGGGGEPRLLEPMGPADRRVVHLAVEGVPGVTTRSQGRGEEKRVLILREGE